eukprot:TRINITY_DN17534_c0_g1_i1.p1 TRINITY_DN17534_c0_g1~~TRINITY_DN17534_c0_g1_i1.p1  ORF type:complete len:216 (+),score=69.43 TRINITY_DN17534_c0_g1_i1:163-810(+)
MEVKSLNLKPSVISQILNGFNIELILDNLEQYVTLEVFDEDIGKDDKMGELKIRAADIINSENMCNQWCKLEKCKSGEILISVTKQLRKETSSQILEHFQEVEVVKTRISEDEDRFSRTSVNEQDQQDENEAVDPKLLIVAKETVSNVIGSAKQQVNETRKEDGKTSSADKSKQEQVKEMISEFLNSDDEDEEDVEPATVRMAICKKGDKQRARR